MASCYACGGYKHHRRKDGTRWCPRLGCLPCGRFLDSTGKPTTAAQRAAIVESVAAIRIKLERRMECQEICFPTGDHPSASRSNFKASDTMLRLAFTLTIGWVKYSLTGLKTRLHQG